MHASAATGEDASDDGANLELSARHAGPEKERCEVNHGLTRKTREGRMRTRQCSFGRAARPNGLLCGFMPAGLFHTTVKTVATEHHEYTPSRFRPCALSR